MPQKPKKGHTNVQIPYFLFFIDLKDAFLKTK